MTSQTTALEELLDSDVLHGLLLDSDHFHRLLSQLHSRETTPDLREDQTKSLPLPPQNRLSHLDYHLQNDNTEAVSNGMDTRSQDARSVTLDSIALYQSLPDPTSLAMPKVTQKHDNFILISSDDPPVEDNCSRDRSIQLRVPNLTRTKKPVSSNRNMQLMLQAPSNELEKWTPADRETTRILQACSGSKKQEGWTYSGLANLITELVRKETERQEHVDQIVLSRDEMACLDMEIHQGIEHRKDAERAFSSIQELLDENNQLRYDVAYMEQQTAEMHGWDDCPLYEDLEEAEDRNEALQDEIIELQVKVKEIQESYDANYVSILRQKQSVRRKLNRGKIAMKTKLATEREQMDAKLREGMKARLEQERTVINTRLEVEMQAKLEREKNDVKATLEAEQQAKIETEKALLRTRYEAECDGERTKLSLLKRKLVLMLADEREGDDVKTRYSSMKRNLLTIMTE
ncbi:hypothetical protein FKW77_005779 [Venturia effusa]|uniref:Uncharacterized protein n=1 Tax=Venturia effusa TaxID=50376 RepID=A0A517L5F4_9PEZI|nr:hypothetical protein FKW77_005779 [Venturia effusa]